VAGPRAAVGGGTAVRSDFGDLFLGWVSVLYCVDGTGCRADGRQGNGLATLRLHQIRFVEGAMTKATESQFIESTAGQVAAELARRGIAPDQHVTVVVEPDDWIAEARRFSRQKVIEAGWSDDDIDRLIKQAQREVEHLLPK
jgi:hypothetical protein